MLVDAYKARQEGTLDASELNVMVAVCEKGSCRAWRATLCWPGN